STWSMCSGRPSSLRTSPARRSPSAPRHSGCSRTSSPRKPGRSPSPAGWTTSRTSALPWCAPSTSFPSSECSAVELVLLEQAPRDDRLLDLRGALADQQERGLPHQALDLVLLGVAVAAVNAERLLHHLGAILRGQQLRHAGLNVVALAGVLEPGGVDHQSVGRLDLRAHLGQLEGDRLVLVQRLAEGLALLRVGDREFERPQ